MSFITHGGSSGGCLFNKSSIFLCHLVQIGYSLIDLRYPIALLAGRCCDFANEMAHLLYA
ncbi:hypothetical protein SAMN04489710_110164 [Paracidovorax konjaci]|uniref:Uncharacterized protein n=1 Tax=Paracidovorax konjaci TaxID=32040 RepID=A0A1I1WPY3_9BURK|nr:hypothetical protein SAMN04489710_110164 [Paracidovorax konjaci]